MMNYFDRREFLRGSSVAAAAALMTWPADPIAARAVPSSGGWDPGSVQHLLPTASHDRVLIKASLRTPLLEAPTLRIGGTSVRGRMTDTRGEFWQFHAADLKPGRPYTLALGGSRGRALCEPWSLATFPGPDERPPSLRVLFYTCAGGHRNIRATWAPLRWRKSSPAGSTARRWCSAATTRRCSSAPPGRRSCRSTAPTSGRSRCSSCRTTTIISTTTKRPT